MDFDTLINQLNESILAESSVKLSEIKSGLEKGLLTKEEAIELVEDLRDADEIKHLADDLEQKIMFNKACDILIAIIPNLI